MGAKLPAYSRRAGFCRFFVRPKLLVGRCFFAPFSVLLSSRFAVFARAVLLPLLLALAVVLGLGSYFETSDDGTLAWLFAGVLALKPVVSLPLYLHGYGHALAAAYAAAPLVPWLGLLLGGLLAGATGLFFAVLDKLLRPHLRPAALVLVLVLFFGVAWLEHWLWFSHGRAAVLLAGAGVLFAAQRPGRRGALLLGLLALGAAWLVRPGLAGLGLVAVLPAALLLAGSWRRAAPVLLGAALGLALAASLLHWQQTPTEARARRRDALLARILDYRQLTPAPRTVADSLGTAAVELWLLGDSTVVNEAFLQRAYRFDAAAFCTREVPAKLRWRAELLVRDYFPLLLALAATGWAGSRRSGRRVAFWAVQGWFGGGLLVLAALLKLPPRLELPLLDFWLLTNLICWLGPGPELASGPAAPVWRRLAPRWRGAVLAGGALVLSLYGAKTWHRQRALHFEQLTNERDLAYVAQRRQGAIPVLADHNDWLKSLSPFRTYNMGRGPVLLLTGWQSADASQAALRRALSGTTDQTECLRRLGRSGPDAARVPAWWLLTPAVGRWLMRRGALSEAGPARNQPVVAQ